MSATKSILGVYRIPQFQTNPAGIFIIDFLLSAERTAIDICWIMKPNFFTYQTYHFYINGIPLTMMNWILSTMLLCCSLYRYDNHGAFHGHGGSPIAGLFHGTSHTGAMDDDWGYPLDLGNLHGWPWPGPGHIRLQKSPCCFSASNNWLWLSSKSWKKQPGVSSNTLLDQQWSTAVSLW